MAEAHAHQGSAAPRKVGPARRIGPSLVCLAPHCMHAMNSAPTMNPLPAPSATPGPDLAQLLQTAVEQAFNAVVITSAGSDGAGPLITYCNSAFCRMTGYARTELLGRSPRILQGPKTDPQVLQRLRECLLSGLYGELPQGRQQLLGGVEHFPRARCPGLGASLCVSATGHHGTGAR